MVIRNEISNIYQLLDNITEELNASGNNCELEFMANNQFILIVLMHKNLPLAKGVFFFG